MLVLGVDARRKIVPIDENDLRYHTVVIGQSGSGKSYFVTRLLEEIVLNTLGRVIVVDPNGDFSSFYLARENSYWEGPKSAELRHLKEQGSLYDESIAFTELWDRKCFQILGTSTKRKIAYGHTNIGHLKIYCHPLRTSRIFFWISILYKIRSFIRAQLYVVILSLVVKRTFPTEPTLEITSKLRTILHSAT